VASDAPLFTSLTINAVNEAHLTQVADGVHDEVVMNW
jgi:hypothetical protein